MSDPRRIGGEASAVISDDGRYRYRLDRRWHSGKGTVAWVMLNPSTADAEKDDVTVNRCTSYSRRWGYQALVVVNLYALRSTDPAGLAGDPDPVGPENRRYQLEAADEADLAVAAWGAHPAARRLPHSVLLRELVERTGRDVMCLGQSKAGHPVHPSRIAADRELEVYYAKEVRR